VVEKIERDPSDLLRRQLQTLTDDSLVHVLPLPKVEHHEISRVVDLRLPDTRESFFRLFQTGAGAGRIGQTDSVSYSRPAGNNISGFVQMLPELIDPAIGGSREGQGGITQAIAGYLRGKDVSGIIYPSARNDCGVEYFRGEMRAFAGWNFVDFRGSSQIPLLGNWVDLSPWRQAVMKGVGAEAPSRGDYSGSLRTMGVAASNAQIYEDSFGPQRSKLLDRMKRGVSACVLLGSKNLDAIAASSP
jgi:hypothetical protein